MFLGVIGLVATLAIIYFAGSWSVDMFGDPVYGLWGAAAIIALLYFTVGGALRD